MTKGGANFASGSNGDIAFTPDAHGTYSVTLTVTDTSGDSTTIHKTLTISVVPPTLHVTGNNAVDVGSQYALSFTETPGPAPHALEGWSIDWGDTNSDDFDADTTSGNHTYATPGTYTITATATDEEGAFHATKVVSVAAVAPTVGIVGNPGSANEGADVALTSSVSDPAVGDQYTYDWEITNGNGASIASSTSDHYTFTPPVHGTYTVDLTVTDAYHAVGHATHQVITVNNLAPTAVGISGSTSGLEGSAVALTSSVSDPGSADTFTYDWEVTNANGDTVDSSTLQNFSFVPHASGSYTVDLTATDSGGQSLTSSDHVVTVANVAPTASITLPETAVEGTSTTIHSDVQDPGKGLGDTFTYGWAVTDSHGSTLATGTNDSVGFTPHHFGNFTVSLSVTDSDGATSTDTKTLSVGNVAPAMWPSAAIRPGPKGRR